MSRGDAFPPIVVFVDVDSDTHALADGFHRVKAARALGLTQLPVDLRVGTREDALWFAFAANSRHGARFSERDKRHAILLALQTWPDKSQHEIAAQLGVDQSWVSQVMSTHHVVPERTHVVGKDGKTYPAHKGVKHHKHDEIVEQLRAGTPTKSIARTLGVGRNTVYSISKQPTPAQPPTVTRAKHDEIVAALHAHTSSTATNKRSYGTIAADLHVSRSIVHAVAQMQALPVDVRAQIEQQLRDGVKQVYIAAATHIERHSVQAVALVLRALDPSLVPQCHSSPRNQEARLMQSLDTIREMANNGATSPQIAAALQVSPRACRLVMAKEDIGCPGDLTIGKRRR